MKFPDVAIFCDLREFSRFLRKSARSGRDAKIPSIPCRFHRYFGAISARNALLGPNPQNTQNLGELRWKSINFVESAKIGGFYVFWGPGAKKEPTTLIWSMFLKQKW